MAYGVEADTMHAGYKVAITGENGVRVRADSASNVSLVWVTGNRRTEQEVDGEGGGEGMGVREGKERRLRQRGINIRHAAPKAKRPSAGASVHHACTASGGGGGGTVESHESV